MFLRHDSHHFNVKLFLHPVSDHLNVEMMLLNSGSHHFKKSLKIS